VVGQVGAFREVLTQQSVGVLVRPALPRRLRATLQQLHTSTRGTLAVQGFPWHARRDSNPQPPDPQSAQGQTRASRTKAFTGLNVLRTRVVGYSGRWALIPLAPGGDPRCRVKPTNLPTTREPENSVHIAGYGRYGDFWTVSDWAEGGWCVDSPAPVWGFHAPGHSGRSPVMCDT
jgi:hypothetical protein